MKTHATRPLSAANAILILMAASCFLPLTVQAAAADENARPNILFAIADDWVWPHAGAYGDAVVKTPAFDRLAREGVLFRHAYVSSPSCTPSRGAILTGQWHWRLEGAGNLWSVFPDKFAVYPELLARAGYETGASGKGWGPGRTETPGRELAGKRFPNFRAFLQQRTKGKPFCYWLGSSDPHRPYAKDSGVKSGMDPDQVVVPPWLPDTPVVRKDILDYYFEVQRFDREVGEMLDLLEKAGKLDNTLVIVTGDNGIPFPRAKATLYDSGTRMCFAACWKAKVKGGRVVDDFVSFTDIAPTFLEAAGLKPPMEMTGRSFLDVLVSGKSGRVDPRRDKVFTERERHGLCREGGKSYPVRAVRTHDFLYVRNLRPELSPSGDVTTPNVVGAYGDVDGSPSKTEIITRREEPRIARLFKMAFAKRPAEELFDLSKDPGQVHNVAASREYAEIRKKLRGELDRWMLETGDPRAKGETDRWDAKCPYVGQRGKPKPRKK